MLAVLVGILAVIALGAAVVGFLWLLQFVLNNEEGQLRQR
jgi:hypothetical protein